MASASPGRDHLPPVTGSVPGLRAEHVIDWAAVALPLPSIIRIAAARP